MPQAGTLTRFRPPTGRNVRVDTHAYDGYVMSPRYDSLLAKVIATGPDLAMAARRAGRALTELVVEGVATNAGLLRVLLDRPELGAMDTGFVDAHLAELWERLDVPVPEQAPEDHGDAAPVRSPQHAVVVAVPVAIGDIVAAGTELVVVEAMKMQHAVRSERAGIVASLPVTVGETVTPALPWRGCAAPRRRRNWLPRRRTRSRPHPPRSRRDHRAPPRRPRRGPPRGGRAHPRQGPTHHPGEPGRPARSRQPGRVRRADDSRPAEPAQRRGPHRPHPRGRLITGTGTVGGQPVAVLAYDYSVLAGTQGIHNHAKTDRLYTRPA